MVSSIYGKKERFEVCCYDWHFWRKKVLVFDGTLLIVFYLQFIHCFYWFESNTCHILLNCFVLILLFYYFLSFLFQSVPERHHSDKNSAHLNQRLTIFEAAIRKVVHIHLCEQRVIFCSSWPVRRKLKKHIHT